MFDWLPGLLQTQSHVYGSLGQVSREREVGPKFETDDETRGGKEAVSETNFPAKTECKRKSPVSCDKVAHLQIGRKEVRYLRVPKISAALQPDKVLNAETTSEREGRQESEEG